MKPFSNCAIVINATNLKQHLNNLPILFPGDFCVHSNTYGHKRGNGCYLLRLSASASTYNLELTTISSFMSATVGHPIIMRHVANSSRSIVMVLTTPASP